MQKSTPIHTGSKPSASTTGTKIGAVRSRMPIQSMKQPRMIHTIWIRITTPSGPTGSPASASWMSLVPPASVYTPIKAEEPKNSQ